MKPMLASAVDPKYPIRFPVMGSPKIDGLRCYIQGGVAKTRSGDPIRNEYIQSILGKGVLDGLDGEICVGNPWDKNLMQQSTSGIMSIKGEPKFSYWVFDVWAHEWTKFQDRYRMLGYRDSLPHYVKELHEKKQLHFLEQVWLKDKLELDLYESSCLSLGYEGIMIRDPAGLYKFGRATSKQGILLKVKRWTDGEARIVGYKEKMHNANELTTDNFGHAKRSTHVANKVPMGTLGSLECIDCETQEPVSIGTGFDDNLRAWFWANRDKCMGQLVTYKHFAQVGVKDASRFPVYKSLRDRSDM